MASDYRLVSPNFVFLNDLMVSNSIPISDDQVPSFAIQIFIHRLGFMKKKYHFIKNHLISKKKRFV